MIGEPAEQAWESVKEWNMSLKGWGGGADGAHSER